MELKTNYQYTYFVHPFAVKENKYQKYILKLLKDRRCNLKRFEKEKDLDIYKFFTPKVREFMFSSFSLPENKLKKMEELPVETRATLISEFDCSIFEYNFGKDVQGKTKDDDTGIFFRIQKIEVICFKTGICFLAIKTTIENTEEFADILNFNYKFRDIKQEEILSGYDNIKIQVENFSNVEMFSDFIRNIIGSNVESMKLGIDTERFLTYSYVCVDSSAWNKDNQFSEIKSQYSKYANILKADSNIEFEKDEAITITKWKYAKLGITKNATTLFTSTAEMNNYTILPSEFENQYFYTYILNLYKILYLKKINLELKTKQDLKNTRKRFVNFTRNLWIQEVTEDEIGNTLEHHYKKVFEIENIYYQIKDKYDVIYKDSNIEKNSKSTTIIAIILVISLLLNILNFIVLMGK